jgi:hypothetical protein
MSEPSFPVYKHSAKIQISRDYAIDYGLVEPTDEERRVREQAHEEFLQRKAVATAAYPLFVAELDAVTDPVARAVLDLHKIAERGECHGCDADGYEWEYPWWPCRTTQAVAAVLGITVPPDLDLAVHP